MDDERSARSGDTFSAGGLGDSERFLRVKAVKA